MFIFFFCFFFFQAEDGIRDHCVTGVQTCALPICTASPGDGSAPPDTPTCTRSPPTRPRPGGRATGGSTSSSTATIPHPPDHRSRMKSKKVLIPLILLLVVGGVGAKMFLLKKKPGPKPVVNGTIYVMPK